MAKALPPPPPPREMKIKKFLTFMLSSYNVGMTQNAIQFIHIDAHAIRKVGNRQSVDGVINEAARIEGFCPHIKVPRPPIITDGISL
jgi:hypothetical protein